MRKKVVTLIGSHGLNASYGGWDQLVNNLAKFNKLNKLNIINPKENNSTSTLDTVSVNQLPFSGHGLSGLFLDFYAIFLNCRSTDTFLILGAKSIPAALFCKFFFKKKVVVNIGGIEWERPQFNFFIKQYLRFCFHLTIRYADAVVLDNQHYLNFVPNKFKRSNRISIIPYGGEVNNTISSEFLFEEYPFLSKPYFLSISRSISDNKILELCTIFSKLKHKRLVLISNLSNSDYGLSIAKKFHDVPNILLIDGLYDKNILDSVRLNCVAYIHTHTLCGSAPSLIEMIVAQKPILSIDVPQNRFTLDNRGTFFTSFDQLPTLMEKPIIQPDSSLLKSYDWETIIASYQRLF